MASPRCYLTNLPIPEPEATTLRIDGPLAESVGPELHLSRPVAVALARWLGHREAGPEPEELVGPGASVGAERP